MATLYKADGTSETVTPKDGKTFSLEELQGFVGGYIQMVEAHHKKILVCNEEGKMMGLPFNEKASEAFVWGYQDSIVGDAVLCLASEIE